MVGGATIDAEAHKPFSRRLDRMDPEDRERHTQATLGRRRGPS
jgi:hypothetical protein